MSKLFPHLFEPITINSLTLPNRIAKAPQSTGMNNKDGTVSERALRYYRDQAAGGAGMIIVEYAYVDEIGAKSAHCHLGISSDEHIAGLAWLAENISEMGAVPAIQIEHCGRQKFLGTQPIKAPSAIAWPTLYAQRGLEAVPQELTIPEIHEIVRRFGDAARRAREAGFRLVEIHGAHGYLLTNFFSPTTNHRTDMYGGTLENRARIFFEVLEEVRRRVGPDFPVTMRLSGTDYEPDGFSIEDTVWLAKELEKRGLDGIDVSGGDHHTMIHQVTPMSLSRCHNTWAAEAIRREVSIPVMASGSITLPEYAEKIVASGQGDMVVLGRPLWADPDWPRKAAEDRPEDICPCIRCNEGCLERTFFHFQAVTCTVNPVISREGELNITPAPSPKRVAVVGGGAAGMTAARVARLRGHDVTVFEEQQRMGGLLNEAAAPEFKADIRPFLKYLETQMEKLGIPVVRRRAEPADLKDFDAVICAAGSQPSIGDIPGKDLPIAMDALTAINHPEKVGKRAVMIGGGLVGTETALDLAEKGHQVTLVEMLPRIMHDVNATDLLAYTERIAGTDMKVLTDTRLEQITEQGAVVSNRRDGRFTLAADTVILALGFRSRDELYRQLRDEGREVLLVGDAVRPGKIFDAVHSAYRAGLRV